MYGVRGGSGALRCVKLVFGAVGRACKRVGVYNGLQGGGMRVKVGWRDAFHQRLSKITVPVVWGVASGPT